MKLIRLLIAIFLFIVGHISLGQETFRDNFGSVSYSNNNGTQNWATDWLEEFDTNLGPTGDWIYISGGRLTFNWLVGENVRRTANLNGATTATLSFSWQTSGLNGSKGLRIQVSNNGGASYTTIGTVSGNNSSGNFSSNIAAFISSNTTIRFTYTGSNWDNNDYAWVDNVQIQVNQLNPSILITDTNVDETAGTIAVTATHNGVNASGPFTVNFSTLNGSAVAGTDYNATSGTFSFNGTAGDTETVIIPILDDGDIEGEENFFLDLTSSSNANVDISDVGEIIINDDELLLNSPLVLVKEFNGSYDYTSAGGSMRTMPNNNASLTDACQIQTISQSPLFVDIPLGATVEKAYLYWAHSSPTPDTNVTFEGQNVLADQAYTSFITTRQFYGYVSDVTSIVQAKANINTDNFTFTDLSIDNSATYCDSQTVLGGWVLMVFYEDVSLPASTINLYQGFDGLSDDSNSYSLDTFFAISGAGSKASFLSWEGDENIAGAGTGTVVENLSVSVPGDPSVTLTGDGGQTGNNPYNSTIFDNTSGTTINITNAYGVDWDTHDLTSILDPGDTQFTANVSMGQDFVISNAVVLKVQSNLIAGTVFEDVNYGGGSGRDFASSSGVPVVGATVEIFDNLGNLWNSTTTDSNGDYSFGGMADGTYNIRVVNSTVRSNRGGGNTCTTCWPVQTYRTAHNGTAYTYITNEIGGAFQSQQDVGAGIFSGAQTVSAVTISGGGLGNIDFGFNFNTIVNTNQNGQGSLAQFIINSNNLDEVGLDIEANAIFDPASGMDTSIFMIPPTGDSLGRTADSNYTNGYFDILVSESTPLEIISDDNTSIDGRTQTAYSGDTNIGSVGAGGTGVGTSSIILPNYDLPEIQVHRTGGNVFRINANGTMVRNLAVFANANNGILVNGGTSEIRNNLLGVNAQGNANGLISNGIRINSGSVSILENYISQNTNKGISINGTSATIIESNDIYQNGIGNACGDNIAIFSGTGIEIRENLIHEANGIGIEGFGFGGAVIIEENSIANNGISGGLCSGVIEDAGIRLEGSGSQIVQNRIYSNGGEGIVLAQNGTGNLISRNSIYGNGTRSDALGIDLDNSSASNKMGDGVTLNDLNDADGGPNGSLNFPIISGVYGSGTSITIEGWSRPGATLEFFMTDINEGTANAGDNQLGLLRDYGEGQIYITTLVEGSGSDLDSKVLLYTDTDGNTDNTNKFKFSIPLLGVAIGELITATATLSNSTSEFSPLSEIRANTVITNKRITYRIKKN